MRYGSESYGTSHGTRGVLRSRATESRVRYKGSQCGIYGGKSRTVWQVFRRVCKDAPSALLASSCVSVRMYVGMYHRDSHWTDFHEIWYWRLLLKICLGNPTSVKWDKSIGHFTLAIGTFCVLTASCTELSDQHYGREHFWLHVATSCILYVPSRSAQSSAKKLRDFILFISAHWYHYFTKNSD